MDRGDLLSKDFQINAFGCNVSYLDEIEVWRLLYHPKILVLISAFSTLQATSALAGMYQSGQVNVALAMYFLVSPFIIFQLFICLLSAYMRLRRAMPGHEGPVAVAPELIIVPVIFAVYRMRIYVMQISPDYEITLSWWQPTISSVLAIAVVSFILQYIMPTINLSGSNETESEYLDVDPESERPSEPVGDTLVQIGNQAIRGNELKMLEAQGNYVKVVTTQGNSLVRGTFSELLKEAENVDGVQIHRSHWVSLDACRGLTRKSKEQFLQLDTGELLKVARSRVKHVEEKLAAHGITTQPN